MTIVVRDIDGVFYSDTKISFDDVGSTSGIKHIPLVDTYLSIESVEEPISISGCFITGSILNEEQEYIRFCTGNITSYLDTTICSNIEDIKFTLILVSDTELTYVLTHTWSDGWNITSYTNEEPNYFGDPMLCHSINTALPELTIPEILIMIIRMGVVDSIGGNLVVHDPKTLSFSILNQSEEDYEKLYTKVRKAIDGKLNKS